jgi:hypothetical protein
MSALQETLFDVLELEAIDKYYLYKDDIKDFAKSPAFIICTGYFAKMGKSSYTVYMGRGIADWTFKRYSDAKAKVLEAISKSNLQTKSFKVIHLRGKPKIYDLIQSVYQSTDEGNKV